MNVSKASQALMQLTDELKSSTQHENLSLSSKKIITFLEDNKEFILTHKTEGKIKTSLENLDRVLYSINSDTPSGDEAALIKRVNSLVKELNKDEHPANALSHPFVSLQNESRTLRGLDLTSMKIEFSEIQELNAILRAQFPQLEVISINQEFQSNIFEKTRPGFSTDLVLEAFANLETLKVLDLSDNYSLTGKGFAKLLNSSITDLRLRGCTNLKTSSLDLIANMKNIEYVDLRKCSKITNVAIYQLQLKKPNLIIETNFGVLSPHSQDSKLKELTPLEPKKQI